jgi:hypothetical protein
VDIVHRFDWHDVFLFIPVLDCEADLLLTFMAMVLLYDVKFSKLAN